jgi:8-oxo-dGTP pyrophosphatase MutT (NUDIX family)
VSLQALLRTNVAAFPRRSVDATDGRRRAAVAVTVLDASSRPRVLLVKRVARGMNPGHWALPGGRFEAGESAEDAALREAHEEVGLRDAEVVGRLDDFVTDSGYVITPVVVIAPEPAVLRRNPDEVHSLHPISLERLTHPGVRRWAQPRTGPRLMQLVLRHDLVVHPPTGAILWQFRELVLGHQTRVADLAQPEWTRR